LRPFDVVGDFSSRLTVLPNSPEAAYNCGGIRAELERQGKPVGVNDLHIGAHARSAGVVGRKLVGWAMRAVQEIVV